jgi:hypothetical protein
VLVEVGPEIHIGAVDAVKQLSNHPTAVYIDQTGLEEHLRFHVLE